MSPPSIASIIAFYSRTVAMIKVVIDDDNDANLTHTIQVVSRNSVIEYKRHLIRRYILLPYQIKSCRIVMDLLDMVSLKLDMTLQVLSV